MIVSPQNLHEDIIDLIGYTKLRHLHILQNRYSPKDTTIRLVITIYMFNYLYKSCIHKYEICSQNILFQPKRSSWVKMRANNPYLKVHFEIESHKSTDILLPIDLLEHCAIPCHSIIMDNPNTQVSEKLEDNILLKTIICKLILEKRRNFCLYSLIVVFTDFAVYSTYSWSILRLDDTSIRF